MHPRCRRVRPGSLGSLGCALGVVGFIRGRWVHLVRPGGCRVHPVSLGSVGCVLRAFGFRSVHWGVPWCRRVHPGSFGVRTGGRRVHQG